MKPFLKWLPLLFLIAVAGLIGWLLQAEMPRNNHNDPIGSLPPHTTADETVERLEQSKTIEEPTDKPHPEQVKNPTAEPLIIELDTFQPSSEEEQKAFGPVKPDSENLDDASEPPPVLPPLKPKKDGDSLLYGYEQNKEKNEQTLKLGVKKDDVTVKTGIQKDDDETAIKQIEIEIKLP